MISVAETTGGQYFRAEDAEQLVAVFDQLPSEIVLQEQDTEITIGFVVAGFVLIGVALLFAWRRPIQASAAPADTA